MENPQASPLYQIQNLWPKLTPDPFDFAWVQSMANRFSATKLLAAFQWCFEHNLRQEKLDKPLKTYLVSLCQGKTPDLNPSSGSDRKYITKKEISDYLQRRGLEGVSLSEELANQVDLRLTGEYGRQWSSDRTLGLITSCAGLSNSSFLKAIDQHITSADLGGDGQPVGSWPPKTAQVLRYARDLEVVERRQEQERRHQALQHLPPTEERTIAVPTEIRAKYDLKETLTLPSSYCKDCSDRGMGRFWYDPKDRRRVWLYAEWILLPDATIRRLNSASAVCDCRIGQERPERSLQTTIYHRGSQVGVPLFPPMEQIRRMAVRRIKQDSEQIGLAVSAPTVTTSWHEPASDGAEMPEVPL